MIPTSVDQVLLVGIGLLWFHSRLSMYTIAFPACMPNRCTLPVYFPAQPPTSSSEAVFPRLTSRPATLETSAVATTSRSILIGPPQDSMFSSSIQSFSGVSSLIQIPVAVTTTRDVSIGPSQDSTASSSLSSQPFLRVSSSSQTFVPVRPRSSSVSSATLSSGTELPQQSTGGLHRGIVAAIVIVVLALVVSAVVVVGLIVCFLRQRRYQFKAKGTNRLPGIGM